MTNCMGVVYAETETQWFISNNGAIWFLRQTGVNKIYKT